MPTLVTNGWLTNLQTNFPHALLFVGGYIWVGCEVSPGRLLRINPADPGTVLTIQLPNDGQHGWVVDMCYIPAKGKFYALCVDPFNAAAITTVIEVNPSTGAFTDVITDASYGAGQGALAFDGSYIYVVSYFTNSVYRYSLSGFGFVSSLSTSLPNPHAMDYDSLTGNLFVTANHNFSGFPQVAQISASSFTLTHLGFWELDRLFSDDIAFAGGYLWAGSEGSGNIVKFPTADISSGVVRVITGIENAGGNHNIFKRSFGVYYDGGVIWTGWEGNPGILGRVNVTTNTVELFEMPDAGQASPNEWVRNGSNLYITGYTQPGWISQLTVQNFDPPDSPAFIQVSDTLAFSDAVLLGDIEHPGVGVGDALNIRDSIRTSYPQFNPLADTLSLSDLMLFNVEARIPVSDTLTILDNGSGFTNIYSDTLTLSDSVAIALNLPAIFNIQKLLGDSFTLVDGFAITIPKGAVGVGDSLFLSDHVKVIKNSLRDDYLRRYLNDVIEIIPPAAAQPEPAGVFLPSGGSAMVFADSVAVTVT